MVGYGKQEIIHFRSMHEACDKSMYDVLQEFAYQTLQDKRRHICVFSRWIDKANHRVVESTAASD